MLAANRQYLEFISTIEDDRAGTDNISGFQNKDLQWRLVDRSRGRISRTMNRLRVHGLIKKIGRTYKYYLTAFGKQVI